LSPLPPILIRRGERITCCGKGHHVATAKAHIYLECLDAGTFTTSKRAEALDFVDAAGRPLPPGTVPENCLRCGSMWSYYSPKTSTVVLHTPAGWVP
jgi:hypothetical protein